MSVCPNCQKKDKEFFAPQCHNCNEHVGFIEQCIHSIIWTVVPIVVVISFFWFVLSLF